MDEEKKEDSGGELEKESKPEEEKLDLPSSPE